MPNWCENYAKISHPDKEKARALEIIDERVACADTRNKLKGLLYADTR